jgi:hypothetical protein
MYVRAEVVPVFINIYCAVFLTHTILYNFFGLAEFCATDTLSNSGLRFLF